MDTTIPNDPKNERGSASADRSIQLAELTIEVVKDGDTPSDRLCDFREWTAAMHVGHRPGLIRRMMRVAAQDMVSSIGSVIDEEDESKPVIVHMTVLLPRRRDMIQGLFEAFEPIEPTTHHLDLAKRWIVKTGLYEQCERDIRRYVEDHPEYRRLEDVEFREELLRVLSQHVVDVTDAIDLSKSLRCAEDTRTAPPTVVAEEAFRIRDRLFTAVVHALTGRGQEIYFEMLGGRLFAGEARENVRVFLERAAVEGERILHREDSFLRPEEGASNV